MPRKRRSLHKAARRREVLDLTLVEFLVTNEQKILGHSFSELVAMSGSPIHVLDSNLDIESQQLHIVQDFVHRGIQKFSQQDLGEE